MVQWVQMSTTADPSLFSPSAHTEQDLTEKRSQEGYSDWPFIIVG